MRIFSGSAHRGTTLAVIAAAEAAVIVACAAIGGASWIAPLLIGVVLGAVAALAALDASSAGPPVATPAADALIDSVTSLPNTDKLLEDLRGALQGSSAERALTLYLFSLNGFKEYNDAYGDACGDALLGWLARKLRDAVGDYGNAYRLRGVSFALLAGGSERFTNELVASAASALNEVGEGFQIFCDVGRAVLPAEAVSPEAALELAARRAHKTSLERYVLSGRRAPANAAEALRMVRPRDDVAALAGRLALRLGVPGREIEHVEAAVHLCDVGNVALPRAVLDYPGKLLGDEWKFILLHTLVGERLLGGGLGMEAVARLVRSSHERWDGAGYPDKLAGDAIPMGSRIVFVCSAFRDMTSDRPHHAALEPADALAQLELGAGSQFDPAVVQAFREELQLSLEPGPVSASAA